MTTHDRLHAPALSSPGEWMLLVGLGVVALGCLTLLSLSALLLVVCLP